MATVLCVPQWQGSASKKAPRLVEGARRTAEHLAVTGGQVTVQVPEVGGEKADGVRAYGAVLENLRLTRQALEGIDGPVITVGGDCGVDLAPVAAARARYGERLTVLWFDAHPDLYHPQTLPSGAFHGMVLRTLLGDGPASLLPEQPLAHEQVVIAGVRTGDPSEFDYIRWTGLRTFGVGELERLLDEVTGPVYVHIDLDVLDPAAFGSVCYPEPDGVPPERLIELVSQLDGVVGAAITEHAPAKSESEPREAEIIQRLGAALRL